MNDDELRAALLAALNSEPVDVGQRAHVLAEAVIDLQARLAVVEAERSAFLAVAKQLQDAARSEDQARAMAVLQHPEVVRPLVKAGIAAQMLGWGPATGEAIAAILRAHPDNAKAMGFRLRLRPPGRPRKAGHALDDDERFYREVMLHKTPGRKDVDAIRAWWVATGQAMYRLNSQLGRLKTEFSRARKRYRN